MDGGFRKKIILNKNFTMIRFNSEDFGPALLADPPRRNRCRVAPQPQFA
jgi:hypothetical protein